MPDILSIPAVEFLRAGAYDQSLLLLARISPQPTPQEVARIEAALQRELRPILSGATVIGKGGRALMTAMDWRRAGALAQELWEEVRAKLDAYQRQESRGKLGRPATPKEIANDIATTIQGRTREAFYQAAFADYEGPVRRILSPVENCRTCPPKARIYPSYQEMVRLVGLPGDGSDQCHGNCMCRVRASRTQK